MHGTRLKIFKTKEAETLVVRDETNNVIITANC